MHACVQTGQAGRHPELWDVSRAATGSCEQPRRTQNQDEWAVGGDELPDDGHNQLLNLLGLQGQRLTAAPNAAWRAGKQPFVACRCGQEPTDGGLQPASRLTLRCVLISLAGVLDRKASTPALLVTERCMGHGCCPLPRPRLLFLDLPRRLELPRRALPSPPPSLPSCAVVGVPGMLCTLPVNEEAGLLE